MAVYMTRNQNYALNMSDEEQRWLDSVLKKPKMVRIYSSLDLPYVDIPIGMAPMWARSKYRRAHIAQLKKEVDRLGDCISGLEASFKKSHAMATGKQLEAYKARFAKCKLELENLKNQNVCRDEPQRGAGDMDLDA